MNQKEPVVGETLRRISPERDIDDPSYIDDLRKRLTEPDRRPPTKYDQFISDPLSIWIESTFGVQTDPLSERLVRAEPCAITGEDGAASRLSRQTGVPEDRCVEALKEGLLAGYRCEPHPDTGFPVFAFRLHQFIGRGDTVHATIEPELNTQLRRAKHRHDSIEPLDDSGPPRRRSAQARQETAQLHRQPPGRLLAGGPFQ